MGYSIRDYQKKTFAMLSGFWLLSGWGKGVWVNPLKEEDSRRKKIFQIMLNKVLKICEK